MSIIKSLSVGSGDMFYIKHGSDNFSIIDCCLSDENKEDIVQEIKREKQGKIITRFISTHPDEDHFHRLKYLDNAINILNFYCVKNKVIKEDETEDFIRYCKLRDHPEKAFYLKKGCERKWLNLGDDERGSSEINILWPVIENEYYKNALKEAEEGECTNNISIVMKYSLNNGITMVWMGDLEKDFMENIKDEIIFSKVNVLIAPHHGRKTGKIPQEWLKEMNPDIIIMGEAPSENLDYASYNSYNKITQNSAGDIIFECVTRKIHIYVSNKYYSVDYLEDEDMRTYNNYIGTLNI